MSEVRAPELLGRSIWARRAEQRRPIEGEGVGLDHPHGVRLEQLPEHGDQPAVELDRRDLCAGVGQGHRERTEAGTDLDDPVPRADAGEPGDTAHRVGVGDEVLAQGAAGAQGMAGEQLADLAARRRHAPDGDAFSGRPPITRSGGPRSSPTSDRPAGRRSPRRGPRRARDPRPDGLRPCTDTDLPVARSVTVTTVPKARSGLAHVPAGAPYHEASPLVEWAGGGGGAAWWSWAAGLGRRRRRGGGRGLGRGRGACEAAAGPALESDVRLARAGAVGWWRSWWGCDAAPGSRVHDTGDRRLRLPRAALTRVGGNRRVRRRRSAGEDAPVDDNTEWSIAGKDHAPGEVGPVPRRADASARPARGRGPCCVARDGVASRRSGTSTRARQHPKRTTGRNPPALCFWVLRSPPFLCGHQVSLRRDRRRR